MTVAAFTIVACGDSESATAAGDLSSGINAIDPPPSPQAPTSEAPAPEAAPPTATPRLTTTPAATTEIADMEPTETAPTSTPRTPTPSPTSDPVATDCVTIADFDAGQTNAEWIVVNDNVMGGRSLGDRSFGDQTMVFTGSINTNGGGFSSLRLPLSAGVLARADRVLFRARSDGRTYLLTFDDALEGRDRRISFRAPLEFTSIGEWETVTVELNSLYAAAFGQRVQAEPFRADLATRVGIMLSDGIDGDFQLEVRSIEACGVLAESQD